MSETANQEWAEKPIARSGFFRFSCKRCASCCRSGALLYPFDVARLARELELPTRQVISRYTEFTVHEAGWFLLQTAVRPKGCVFLNDSSCLVYPARPMVCRMFPLGRNLDEDGAQSFFLNPSCPGLDDGPIVEVDAQLKAVEPELGLNNAYSAFVLSVVSKLDLRERPRDFYYDYMLRIYDWDSWKKPRAKQGSKEGFQSVFALAQKEVLDRIHMELREDRGL